MFLTNTVKCCYDHSFYPDSAVIQHQLKLLAEEIRIVRPESIVAFGGLVYKVLTGDDVKLNEYRRQKRRKKSFEVISGLNTPVAPCYFPVGRGRPALAAKILKRLVTCKP